MKVKYEINCGFMLHSPLEHGPRHLGDIFYLQSNNLSSSALLSLHSQPLCCSPFLPLPDVSAGYLRQRFYSRGSVWYSSSGFNQRNNSAYCKFYPCCCPIPTLILHKQYTFMSITINWTIYLFSNGLEKLFCDLLIAVWAAKRFLVFWAVWSL